MLKVEKVAATPRKRKYTKRLDPVVIRKMIADYEHNGMTRDEVCGKYGVSAAVFYKHTKMARARLRAQNKSANISPPMSTTVTLDTPTEPETAFAMLEMQSIDREWLELGELDMDTLRYIRGACIMFDKTTAQIIDDLVVAAREIGVEIHAQKA